LIKEIALSLEGKSAEETEVRSNGQSLIAPNFNVRKKQHQTLAKSLISLKPASEKSQVDESTIKLRSEAFLKKAAPEFNLHRRSEKFKIAMKHPLPRTKDLLMAKRRILQIKDTLS